MDEQFVETGEMLAAVVEALKVAVQGHSEFYPYKYDAQLAYVHDSPANRLTAYCTMMVGREPQTWSRQYFVRREGLTEEQVQFVTYDAGVALENFIETLAMVQPRQFPSETERVGSDATEALS